MKKQSIQIAIASLFLIGTVACGGNAKTESESTEEGTEMHEDHEGHADHAEHGEMDHSDMESTDEAELLSIPEGASVAFGNLKDGDKISMPFTVEFLVSGMEVEPAGELLEGKGHHHLIIDNGAIERGAMVPADSVNIHFGKGQTETELNLTPGPHTLTMQFADGYHQSYGKQMSSTVSIIVE